MKSYDLIIILLVCLTILLAIWLLGPATSEKENLKEQLLQTQLQVKELDMELNEVRTQLQKLKEKDPAVIEKIARDKFGQAREGEVIYKFPKEGEVKRKNDL